MIRRCLLTLWLIGNVTATLRAQTPSLSDQVLTLQALPLDDARVEALALDLLRGIPDQRTVLTVWIQHLRTVGRGDQADAVEGFVAEVLDQQPVNSQNPSGDWHGWASEFRSRGDRVAAAAFQYQVVRHTPIRVEDVDRYLLDIRALGLREVELRELQRWIDPDEVPVSVLQAAILRLRELGSSRTAMKWALIWVHRAPEQGEAHLLAGEIALDLMDYDGAMHHLVPALQQLKDPLPAWKALARLSAYQRDSEQAVVWLKRIRPRLNESDWMDFLLSDAFSHVPEILDRL